MTEFGISRAAMLAVVLPLAMSPAIGSAQGAVGGGGGRAGRADTVIVLRSTEARLARVRMELDSLVDRLVEDDLSTSERRAVTERMRTLMTSLQQQLTRESTERAVVAGTMRARVGGVGGGPSGRALIELQRGENGFVTTRIDTPFKGWIGLNTIGSQRDSIARGEIFIRYLGSYPRIVSVDPNSPAASAGILKGDLLVAYDGDDVVERGFSATKLLQPSRAIRVTVERDGDRRDYPVVVASAPTHVMERRREFGIYPPGEPPAMAPRAFVPRDPDAPNDPERRSIAVVVAPDVRQRSLMRAFSEAAILGARVEQMNEELGDIFGVSQGVIVISVADDALARRSGLRAGDVIVKVDGAALESVVQLRRALERANSRDRTLDLAIIRKHKPASITLQW